MALTNYIQRPDLLARLRTLLGIRGQLSLAPRLSGELVPVVIVADVDRPIRGMASRRRFLASLVYQYSAVSPSAISFGTPTTAPWLRVYPQWADFLVQRAVGTDPIRLDVYQHPTGVSVPGFPMDPGHGGDVNPGGRAGLASVSDVTGFPDTGIRFCFQHNVPRVIDLSGFVLEARNPPPGAGGQGSSLMFAAPDATPLNILVTATFAWEEEEA